MLVIASFLGIQDPRERRPKRAGGRQRARAVRRWALEFVGVLRLWDGYRQAHEDLTQSKLRDWCGRFLGFLRMREWRELHRQLRLLCEELGWREEEAAAALAPLLAGAQ
jgi:ATP-dependent helicase HrpA